MISMEKHLSSATYVPSLASDLRPRAADAHQQRVAARGWHQHAVHAADVHERVLNSTRSIAVFPGSIA